MQRRREVKLEVLLQRLFKGLSNDLSNVILEGRDLIIDNTVTDIATPLENLLLRELKQTALMFGRHQLSLFRKDANFIFKATVNEQLAAVAAAASVYVTESTLEEVRAILSEAARAGKNPDTQAKLIKEKLGIQTYKARRIARTESHAAAMLGQHEAIMAVDDQADKEWVAIADKITRPSHNEANGQRVRMGEFFNVSGFPMRQPGDYTAPIEERIECRCMTIYHPKQGTYTGPL